MANFEQQFHSIINGAGQFIQKVKSAAGIIGGKLKGFKASFYDKSGEVTKRSVSGAAILFTYLIVITVGGALYSTVMLIGACISLYEFSTLMNKHKNEAAHQSYIKQAAIVTAITFGSLIQIRFGIQGARVTFWLFLTVATVDTMAYVVGKSFGKTKILPNISPNKTLEGAIGGSASALLINIALYPMLSNYGSGFYKFIYFVVASAVLIIAAQFGDALQSSIKRHLGVKDMGQLIPGHGGIADRLDSFIVAAPVALLLTFIVKGQLF